MPRRPPLTLPGSKLAAVGLALTLSACAGPGPVSATVGSSGATGACSRAMAALPDRVHGFTRRDVRPAAAAATFAAWGDPPITLSCAVPRPAALRAESTLLDVDGVDWFSEPLPRGTRFTTTGFAVNIRVEVPEDYTTPTDALTDLASAVARLPSS